MQLIVSHCIFSENSPAKSISESSLCRVVSHSKSQKRKSLACGAVVERERNEQHKEQEEERNAGEIQSDTANGEDAKRLMNPFDPKQYIQKPEGVHYEQQVQW